MSNASNTTGPNSINGKRLGRLALSALWLMPLALGTLLAWAGTGGVALADLARAKRAALLNETDETDMAGADRP